jgi:hypothetical protein
MRLGVPSTFVDADNVAALPLADDSLLAAIKLRYGLNWRIWEARDGWHAHRIGDFHQESWPGAPKYAVSAPELLGLAVALQDETDRDSATRNDRKGARSKV